MLPDFSCSSSWVDRKLIEGGPAVERRLYTTFLASSFRTLRFGLKDAHGKGMAMQVNYLTDNGGFVARPDGRFEVNFEKIKSAVRDLDHDLLTLEATGDYAGAKRMLDQLGVIRPNMQKALDGLNAHSGGYRAGVRYSERARARALTCQLRDVVVDCECDHGHQEHEPKLEHRFLHAQAQIAAHEHLHQQQEDDAAVQDRDGQQIEDRQVQAQHGGQPEVGAGAFPRRFARQLRDSDRAFQRISATSAAR